MLFKTKPNQTRKQLLLNFADPATNVCCCLGMHCWRLWCHWTLSWPQGLSSYHTLLWVGSCGRIPAHTVLAACSSPRHSLVPNLDCRHALLTAPLRKPQVLLICLLSCILVLLCCAGTQSLKHTCLLPKVPGISTLTFPASPILGIQPYKGILSPVFPALCLVLSVASA